MLYNASLISEIFISIGVAMVKFEARFDLGTKQAVIKKVSGRIKSIFMACCLTSVLKSNTICAKSPIFVAE